MASPINVPINVQTQNQNQLTRDIQSALNKVRLNLGGNSRALSSLSQPLGRLTGQADEFTKSLDAANARVLAFGASVGIVNAFSNAFKSLVASTIEVEKAIKAITVVGDQFNGKTKELSQGLFNVAKATGQSFAQVSQAALEFSRQGLGVAETLQRTQDALILTRLTGLDAAKSVEGLTAAVNGFSKAGLTTTQVLNKLAAVDQAFAVSSADLIEGFNRSAAVAQNAGVTFDELAGIITSLQQQTSRGGAVIGNALKTIFTRLQDTSTLNQLQSLGVAVTDLENNLLPARQILQNLATDIEGLGQITRAGIFKDVAGTFQINQLISLVSDLNNQNSIAATATRKAAGATNEAFAANEKLNQSLDAIINKVTLTGKQVGALLGELGLSEGFKFILDSLNSFLEGASKLLQGDDLGSKFAKGLVKGIGSVLTGPGFGLFLAIIGKLTIDIVKFGTQSLKTFFGIGQAAKQQQLVQESIVQTLLRNQSVLNTILTTQGGQNAQALAFLNILNSQEAALQKIRSLAGGIAAPLIGAGYGVGPQGGIQRRGRAAGGYLPAQEAADVRRGVGGASPNSKVVAIPNFAFGGGKRGTMIANTSEYIVPNYAGGGSAIFNQDMVKTMGLPPGAKKIGAAGGFIPNFARYVYDSDRIQPDKNALLNAILKSTAKKNLIVGPAGSGKSTYAKSLGAFITNASQLSDAKEIDILSGAARAKGGGFSKNFSQILEAVKDSGGQVSYLYANNLDILSRRSNRFLSGPEEGDLRSKKQLGGSRYAPLNQYDFLSQIKSASSNFQLIRGAGGFIPNFAEQESMLEDVSNKYALIVNEPVSSKPETVSYSPKGGALKRYRAYSYGVDLNKLKNPDLYKEEFSSDALVKKYTDNAIKDATKFANEAIGQPIAPISISKLANAGSIPSLVGNVFETAIESVIKDSDYLNRLKDGGQNALFDFIDARQVNDFFGIPEGVKYVEAKYKATPDTLKSFARKIYTQESKGVTAETSFSVTDSLREKIKRYKDLPGQAKIAQSLYKEIASDMGLRSPQDKKKIDSNIAKILGRASTGYIPNFAASALQEAIAREKSAGLSSSQIYVDQSPALKSSSNPMGLMVANTRDEPAGGFQGIARARREGANPKLYGAANGFVPNFAPPQAIDRAAFESSLPPSAKKSLDAFADLIDDINKKLAKNKITQDEANKKLEQFVAGIKAGSQNLNPTKGKGLQAVQAAQSQLITPTPKEAKGAGDALAKVFALQTAFFGLSETITSIAGEGSAAAEGLQKFGGIITAALSGLTLMTAGLGGIGIALGIAVASFNVFKSVFPNAIQSMMEAFGALSIEGKKASDSLDKFSEQIVSGGATPQQAFENAVKQAQEAQLRVSASKGGIQVDTGEGKAKDPAQLARELIFGKLEESLKDFQFGGTKILKNTGRVTNIPNVGGIGASAPVRIEEQALLTASFKDLNESTRQVIFDNLKEAVNLTKEGLLILAEQKNINLKDLNLDSIEGISKARALLLEKIFIDNASQIKTAIQRATDKTSGKLDQNKLQKLLLEELGDVPKNILAGVVNALPAFVAAQPAEQLRKNLNDLLLAFDNLSSEINRSVTNRTALLEGLTSSATFSALGEAQQFQIKSGLDRFKANTTFEKNQRDLLSRTRSFVSGQAKNLEATQGNPLLLKQFQEFVESGTLEDFETNFANIASQTKLVGDDLTSFQNSVSELINANRDLKASRETENTLLEFSIQERQNELASMKAFYNGIGAFTQGIRKQEAQLRNIDFELKKVQQEASFQKDLLNIEAPTLDAFRSGTMDIENKAFDKETDLRRKQIKIQADIELKRNLYTLENITALNRNTDALQANLTSVQEKSLSEEINSLQEIITNEGRQLTSQEEGRLRAAETALSSLRSPAQTLPTQQLSFKMEEMFAATTEEAKTAILNSIPNQAQRENFRKIYEENSNSIKAQTDILNKDIEFQRKNQDNQRSLFEAQDSYTGALTASVRGLQQRLRSDPMSRGQFAAGQRGLGIAAEEERRFKTGGASAIQEYRSSFGRGIEDALGPLEEKTLDFKNELGREIPQLFSQNLAQGLNDAISGAKSLKNALQDAALSFLNAISQKNIENLANMFTVGVGNFFSPKRSIEGLASGGMIKGGSGAKDDVPAMLMGGEYVIKKSAVKKYGSSFLDALNNGSIKGFAKGGGVQSGAGGFYVPGDYGEGSIRGKSNLLAFAGQSFTSGQYDTMGGFGLGGASVSLEAESARLTAFGRENSPLFERVQSAKDEAFQVYLQQLGQEKQYRDQLKQMEEAEKARKKQLTSAIVSAVASVALSGLGKAAGAGFKNAAGIAKAADKGLGGQFVAGLGGIFKGGNGQGGLGNLFSGNFSAAFNSGKNIYGGADNKQYIGYSLGNISYPYKRVAGGMTYGSQAAPGSAFTSEYNALPANIKSQLRDYGSDGYYRPYGRANGGMIYGGSGVRDDVPAMLTGGEFVLNNRATRKLGVQNLSRLNAGETTGGEDRSGAITESLLSKLDELIQATRESAGENVVVNVNSSEASGENQNAQGSEKELHKKIRQAVLDVIAQEKRLGGSLSDKNR